MEWKVSRDNRTQETPEKCQNTWEVGEWLSCCWCLENGLPPEVWSDVRETARLDCARSWVCVSVSGGLRDGAETLNHIQLLSFMSTVRKRQANTSTKPGSPLRSLTWKKKKKTFRKFLHSVKAEEKNSVSSDVLADAVTRSHANEDLKDLRLKEVLFTASSSYIFV